MGRKPAHKMDISERAKQFMPFDALTGFDEAIEAIELKLSKDEEILLSDNQKEEINDKIVSLKKNDEITVRYYKQNHYQYMTGIYQKIDTTMTYMVIGNEMIRLDSIVEIFKEEQL